MNNDEDLKDMLSQEDIPQELLPENMIKKLKDKENSVEIATNSPNLNENTKKNINLKLRIIATAAASVMLFVGCYAIFSDSMAFNSQIKDNPEKNIVEEKDYEDVFNSLQLAYVENQKEEMFNDVLDEAGDFVDGLLGTFKNDAETSDDAMAPESNSQQKDYSDTLKQVAGIDEADIIKTDGENIFYCANNRLFSFKVDNGEFSSVKEIKFGNDSDNSYAQVTINGMYLVDSKLVLVYLQDQISVRTSQGVSGNSADTCVSTFDISSGEAVLSGDYRQEGRYIDSRMVDEYLYLISNTDKIYNDKSLANKENIESYIPTYTHNGEVVCVEPGSIAVPDEIENFNYTIVGGLDTSNIEKSADVEAFLGNSGIVYCSAENLYVVSSMMYNTTSIIRAEITDGQIDVTANGEVDGYVINQFSMDEYNEHFRIATTIRGEYSNRGFEIVAEDSSTVYVLDMDLEVVGKVEGLGKTEHIKSVNFQGDTGYVVTFRQTDPLYSIDLANPKEPKVMDELKVTGYSSFMHKWDDEYMLGFGPEASSDGRISGLKVSMFDISDSSNLSEKAYLGFGVEENADSIAVGDRKALLLSPEKNVIAFPFYIYNNDGTLDNGYALVKYEDEEFKLVGTVSYSLIQTDLQFDRAVYIDDVIYMFSPQRVVSARISDMAVIDGEIIA